MYLLHSDWSNACHVTGEEPGVILMMLNDSMKALSFHDDLRFRVFEDLRRNYPHFDDWMEMASENKHIKDNYNNE